jgi:hypothetical protein
MLIVHTPALSTHPTSPQKRRNPPKQAGFRRMAGACYVRRGDHRMIEGYALAA